MRSMSAKVRNLCATVGLVFSMQQAADAETTVTMRTRSLVPSRNGYLSCKVTATSPTPIGIVATIKSAKGANVTEFSTGFRASPEVTGDGLFYGEESAGSLNDRARYCEVTVTGAQAENVHVTLAACDANDDCGEPAALR